MNWNQWGPADLHSRKPAARPKTIAAARGLVLEDAASGFTGAIVRTEKSGGVHLVVLEGRRGVTRSFPLGLGFMIDGQSRSEEHTSELQSRGHLVCRLLLEKK